MFKELKASWGKDAATITNVVQLRAIIHKIRQSGQPTMLFLEATTGVMLIVGLGAPESVLTLVEQDDLTYHSLGDINRRDCLQFLNGEVIDDFDADAAIPEQQAIEAALEFFDTGQRPQCIKWEGDW